MKSPIPKSSYPFLWQRNSILALLLIFALLAWFFLFKQTAQTQAVGRTMDTQAGVFLSMWIVMMIAMMFPTAAPMILMFSKVSAHKEKQQQPFVPTWLFVSAYLLLWTLFGVVAFFLAIGAEKLAMSFPFVMQNAPRIGGGVIMLAGLYQLSPLKRSCLAKCRTPLDFLLGSWRDGYLGSFRMGLEHGMYCLGCCWLLFVILFPLGIMNIGMMILITALIFAEKSLPIGPRISKIAALLLVAYGILVFLFPQTLPTMKQSM